MQPGKCKALSTWHILVCSFPLCGFTDYKQGPLFNELHITTYIVKPLSRINKSLDSLIAPLFIDVSRIQRVPWNLHENITFLVEGNFTTSEIQFCATWYSWFSQWITKSLDLNYLSWQIRPFALSSDGRKVWATVLFLRAIMRRKVIHIKFFVFSFCRTTVCWDPDILLPLQHDVTTSPLYSPLREYYNLLVSLQL